MKGKGMLLNSLWTTQTNSLRLVGIVLQQYLQSFSLFMFLQQSIALYIYYSPLNSLFFDQFFIILIYSYSSFLVLDFRNLIDIVLLQSWLEFFDCQNAFVVFVMILQQFQSCICVLDQSSNQSILSFSHLVTESMQSWLLLFAH